MSATGLPKNPFTLLSTREQDVLRLVARDRTDREIARELDIRERTVRAHVSRIILKLDVASRVGAAVAFAVWSTHREISQGGGSDMSEAPIGSARPVASR
ncbi:response regulator transcription factor [Actinophytocola sp.]|uniref:response regulator transcription factor n=1 Tax=Actinophytocola sp. TaxID=1872138 RepID=UPI002ECFE26D